VPGMALKTSPEPESVLATQPDSAGDTAGRLFAALADVHLLKREDAVLLARARAGCRFIRAMHPFGDNERSLMRIALADLSVAESFVVEASANRVAELAFEDEHRAWSRLSDDDKRRVLWFTAILRLAEGMDAVRHGSLGAIRIAGNDETLTLETAGASWSEHDVGQLLGCTTALEAISGRRVVLTSSAPYRGVASHER
jgi:hypothetical protein